ncbi:MAG: hypothetical protein FWF10_08200 [Clostridiales bacterium]|nr:hypothetical protein [Clostridiales bacterium]
MSLLSFIAFPRELDKSHLDVNVPELQVYEKDASYSFEKVFANSFIYSLDATHAAFEFCEPIELDILRKAEAANMHMADFARAFAEETHMSMEKTLREMDRYGLSHKNNRMRLALRCRTQLYDLVQLNIHAGETVEIFSCVVRTPGPVRLGPPKETRTLISEEVLVSELLDLRDGVKIEVRLL